jgi:hypothetical protein
MAFSSEDIYPGWSKDLGSVVVRNSGTVAGKVSLKVSSVISNENTETEPEMTLSGAPRSNGTTSVGKDMPGVQVDPTGYTGESGAGELWDQMNFTFYVDNDPHNGRMEWYEPVIWRAGALDMTSSLSYRIPIDTNIFPADHGFDETLSPGEEFAIGVVAFFFSDTSGIMASQPQYNGLNNNMAMTDDVEFDIVFGLDQL